MHAPCEAATPAPTGTAERLGGGTGWALRHSGVCMTTDVRMQGRPCHLTIGTRKTGKGLI